MVALASVLLQWKTNPMLPILTILTLLPTLGTDFWITQPGSGAADGTSFANSAPITFANTASNYGIGPGKVNFGDRLLFTNSFVTPLAIPASGDTGNPITFLFTGSSWITNCWPTSGAISATSKSNLVLNGGPGITWSATDRGNGVSSLVLGSTTSNGIIRNTSNGSGLATTNNSVGILLTGCNNITLCNMVVSNMYTKITGNIDQSRVGYPIELVNCTLMTCVSNLVADGDAGITLSMGLVSQQDLDISHNILLRCNHTGNIGIGNTNSYATNIRWHHNYHGNWLNWDAPGNTQIHLDGIIILNNSYDQTSIIDNLWIYNNFFDGDIGTRTTAGIFNSMANPYVQAINWKQFNNIFRAFTGSGWGNGFMNLTSSNNVAVNNTAIGVIGATNYGGGFQVGGTNSINKNNILLSGSGFTFRAGSSVNESSRTSSGTDTEFMLTNYFPTLYSDYNIIGGTAPGFQIIYATPGTGDTWLSGILTTLPVWQTWNNNNRGMTVPIWNTTHADPHSITTVPIFDATFVPNTTAAFGTNLTSLAIPELNVDYYNNPRPSTGLWYVGAVQSSPPASNLPVIVTGKVRFQGVVGLGVH